MRTLPLLAAQARATADAARDDEPQTALPPNALMDAYEAVRAGDVERLRELLPTIDVNAKFPNTDTRLIRCATGAPNATDLIRALVDAGADVNAAGYAGFTPLHSVAYDQNVEQAVHVGRVLLHRGASLAIKDADQCTPFVRASLLSITERAPIMALFARHGANPTRVDTGFCMAQRSCERLTGDRSRA